MDSIVIPGLNKPISRLVQGTLGIPDADADSRLFDEVFELGCTAFDTARVYASGDAERNLGRWLQRRGVRNEVVVISKGCHPRGGRARMRPECLEEDVASSLEALQVEQIDLYLLHRDDQTVPVSEIVDALNRQLEAGRVAALGVSNWTHQRIEEANAYAARAGLRGFVVSSPGLSLAKAVNSWPGCVNLTTPDDDETLAWYRQQGFPLLGWSPLAAGFLSGHFQSDAGTDDAYLQQVGEFYACDANFARLSRARRLADELKVSVAQLAIAYVFSHRLNALAVVGCRTSSQFRQCMNALDVELSAHDVAWLDGSMSHR